MQYIDIISEDDSKDKTSLDEESKKLATNKEKPTTESDLDCSLLSNGGPLQKKKRDDRTVVGKATTFAKG